MKGKVGFIGLGIMGSAMARNIKKAGYPLVVYNRTADKAEEFDRLGAEVAPSPRSLAALSDIIIAMVTGPEAIEELLWGEDGVKEELDGNKIFINMSTVSPSFTRTLAQRLSETGAQFLDAPVSGTKKPAEDGTLLILAGGSKRLVDRCTPLLESMGKRVIHCGEIGQGSMMKMAVNLLLGLMMEGLAEVLNFGSKGGLSLEAMLDVIFSGPLNCDLYQGKSDMLRLSSFPASFPLKHMTKDLKFVVDTAFEIGAPVPAAHTAAQLYRLGVGQDLGDLDMAAVAKVLEYLTGRE